MKFISKVDSDDIKLGKVYDGKVVTHLELIDGRSVVVDTKWVSIICEDGRGRLFDIKNLQSLTEFRENILNQLLN